VNRYWYKLYYCWSRIFNIN